MSAREVETVLAKLYTEDAFLASFLKDAPAALAGFDLTHEEIASFMFIDRDGLILASRSFTRKREKLAAARAPVRRALFLKRIFGR